VLLDTVVRASLFLLAFAFAGAACNESDLGNPCGKCANGKKDGDETDVDCGGWCQGCADGKACAADWDCASSSCNTGATSPTCVALETPGRVSTRESVGQSTAYPCESLICVASGGKPGYCSQKCRNDAGCPQGFECRVIMTSGTFANEKFCAWKSCDTRGDCGNVDELCCSSVPGADPVQDIKMCEHANDEGKCGG
jgi:hypothetical protein